ncbi:MarR family winged helix-turn-helix transcriptional regulator [Candidatus Frankia nodulisporulans]|uniref:MarR family winged helix-turn-helix transcriptional regulator n=1 Tax=Candidatus Frankia nodulisporulans TaxID=2060052 RepID=UPI001CDB6787|nr:hypothetical protein [Candidatus Frankia nodulisporulans]
MEQRGLVQRQTAQTDRRQKVISLTARGVEVRTRLVQTLTAGSPLAQLSPDDQQHLHALLAKAGGRPEPVHLPTSRPLQHRRRPGGPGRQTPPERLTSLVRRPGGLADWPDRRPTGGTGGHGHLSSRPMVV